MLTLSRIANLIEDFEISDMFKMYLKLADEDIIHVTDEDSNITFYYSDFLFFISRHHSAIFKDLTKTNNPADIWFCSFYYSEEYELHFAMWINNNGVSFGGGGDGVSYRLSSEKERNLLKTEMKKHLDIMLTFKSLFYDEYRRCRIP